MTNLARQLLELTYIVIGCQFLHTAYCSYKDKTNPVRYGTAGFWALLGISFIGGSYLPSICIGVIVVLLALLTLFKQVRIGTLPSLDEVKANFEAKRLKNKIFIPVMLMALIALVLAKMIPEFSKIAISLAAFLATISLLLITKSSPKSLLSENNRMVQQVSTSGIVPQLLGALGAIFTVAGVGDLMSHLISGFVPSGSRLICHYCWNWCSLCIFLGSRSNRGGCSCYDSRLLWDSINPNGCQFQYSTCSPFGYERSKWRYQSTSRSSYCHDYHTCISDVLFGILVKEIK